MSLRRHPNRVVVLLRRLKKYGKVPLEFRTIVMLPDPKPLVMPQRSITATQFAGVIIEALQRQQRKNAELRRKSSSRFGEGCSSFLARLTRREFLSGRTGRIPSF